MSETETKEAKKIEKQTCSFCKHKTLSWVDFVSDNVQATICPSCLMWGADPRIGMIRQGLSLSATAQKRAGILVAKGGVYDGQ